MKLNEVYGHFAVLDFCEAYGCFIALPCWFQLSSCIGYPTASSVKMKLNKVYGHFTVLDLFEAYGCFIAHLVGMILTIIKENCV